MYARQNLGHPRTASHRKRCIPAQGCRTGFLPRALKYPKRSHSEPSIHTTHLERPIGCHGLQVPSQCSTNPLHIPHQGSLFAKPGYNGASKSQPKHQNSNDITNIYAKQTKDATWRPKQLSDANTFGDASEGHLERPGSSTDEIVPP